MNRPIILIGPMETGKSTVAGLLAPQLGLAHHELDELRWGYYKEIGYDEELANKLGSEQGFEAIYRYWKPFEIYAVERVLADCAGGVISFGAGHSVYEDEALFERAQRALEPYANVILILPCEDEDEATAILAERFSAHTKEEGFEPSPQTLGMIGHFVRHPSNRRLAKRVVYTRGKTPQETCEEVFAGLAE